jgi:nicotinate-nucleotide adenylyltransferase
MRLGIFGGTFDPVHFGHLVLAEQCREQCALDEVWFLPSGSPPHKDDNGISDGEQRADMLEFAVAGHSAFKVNRLELKREGTTYTVDTLSSLMADDASRELFFLIGGDSLNDLPTWREPWRIAELARIVAVNRGDRPIADVEPLRAQLGDEVAERITLATMPGIDLSSTDIRQRVRAGNSIRYMTPRAVEAYIHEHGLYRDA